jgi:2-polyprenyl-6-methoxyphenol hydroxylase-like FAD-dependent oxidoreductase
MVTFSLSDGTRAQTRLLVAADGARSLTRDKAGIKTIGWPYEQKGIVANVVVDRPNHTAWQRFTPTGPIALLPLHRYVTVVCPQLFALN